MKVEFKVAGRPQQRGSKRPLKNKKTGAVLMVDDNAKSRPWMEAVTNAAAEAMNGGTLLDGPLCLAASFYFARPKSHFRTNGKLKETAGLFHAGRPDTDKLLRGIGDAMTGVVYRDDAQIARIVANKFYTETSEGVEIEVKLI